MRTFDGPSFITPTNTIWDVCFFSFPYIIETNVMIPQAPASSDQFFSYYTKLSVFLKNRKSLKLGSALGFDADGVYRMDDTWLEPGQFENALANDLIGGPES